MHSENTPDWVKLHTQEPPAHTLTHKDNHTSTRTSQLLCVFMREVIASVENRGYNTDDGLDEKKKLLINSRVTQTYNIILWALLSSAVILSVLTSTK